MTEQPRSRLHDLSTNSDSLSAIIGTDDWESEGTERTGGNVGAVGVVGREGVLGVRAIKVVLVQEEGIRELAWIGVQEL